MRHPFTRSLALLAALTITALTSVAEDKIAYINMEKIFEEFHKTVNANIAFEMNKKDFEERLSMLRGELESLAKETQKFEEESQNELLSMAVREDARRKFQLRYERLRGKNDEFERFRQENMQRLQRIRASKEEELVEELMSMVKKIAEVRNYTHIYEVSGRTLNRVPVLIVYPKELEITDVILNIANAGHEDELAEAKVRYENLRKRDTKPAADEKAPAEENARPRRPRRPQGRINIRAVASSTNSSEMPITVFTTEYTENTVRLFLIVRRQCCR